MAFKTNQPRPTVPDSPEKLLLDLPKRKIPSVMPHQAEVMQRYAKLSSSRDLAFQLPTGSGKTLVGLLIAEWRRRKNNERVVYLCPTAQLVNQVAEQAQESYGLSVTTFTGAKKHYSAASKSSYSLANRIAITTYSSLFNSNPYFDSPDIIVLDDAHAAENYIASMWSLRIERSNKQHAALHEALKATVSRFLNSADRVRVSGGSEGPVDWSWTDKLPTKDFLQIRDEVTEILDAHAESSGLLFNWSSIKDHLHACHLYLSTQDILIRPLLPPTWSHDPFTKARQRIYMSATLGAGGDLERLTGVRSIKRIPAPDGWDRQGVGRRMFIFPSLSLDDDASEGLRHNLMKLAGRSIVLTPSESAAQKVKQGVAKELGFSTYDADAIELSKSGFTEEDNAVAVIANRYDGIDFPGDECRLLFIEGLPRGTNTQERFLMSRMGANAIYNERIQTRVLQAIGRCTRSLNDYSAVVISGSDLPDYLGNPSRRKHFHPDLQAELEFGLRQSTEVQPNDIADNFRILLDNGDEWEEANSQIVQARDDAEQEQFPALEELEATVSSEIKYQENMWRSDFATAMEEAQKVVSRLTSPDTKGYRALWQYLAGSAAWQNAELTRNPDFYSKAKESFVAARSAARAVPWLTRLATTSQDPYSNVDSEHILVGQLERVESVLSSLGTLHDGNFAKREKEILEGLSSDDSSRFENAQRLLGELLGFVAGKVETQGSPDPWWISGGYCIVFEDHSSARAGSSLSVDKSRQAASHPNWIRANVEESSDCEIVSVLVTPVSFADKGAIPHLEHFSLWSLDDYRSWARNALSVVRNVRRSFTEPGNLRWRASASEAFSAAGLAAPGLFEKLKSQVAAKGLKERT